MASKNGIVTIADKRKLDSYPTLNNNTDTFLNGSGVFITINAGGGSGGGSSDVLSPAVLILPTVDSGSDCSIWIAS